MSLTTESRSINIGERFSYNDKFDILRTGKVLDLVNGKVFIVIDGVQESDGLNNTLEAMVTPEAYLKVVDKDNLSP